MSLFRKLLMMQQNESSYKTIDLGLPSGNLWADRNIGATTPEDSGLYFQWGDTQGYTAEQVGDGEGLKAFSCYDYKFWIYSYLSNFTKYNASDRKTVLDPEDDAAHVNMKGNWRMPTLEGYNELCFNTDIYLVPTDGEEIQGIAEKQSGTIRINWMSQAQGTLKGVKFYKKGDKQTYIFIPAAGSASNGSVLTVGKIGNLWFSSRSFSDVRGAWGFSFSARVGTVVDYNSRCVGFSVRGVLKV